MDELSPPSRKPVQAGEQMSHVVFGDLRVPLETHDAEDSETIGRTELHDLFIEQPDSIAAGSPARRPAEERAAANRVGSERNNPCGS
jgi:hypothetical protein